MSADRSNLTQTLPAALLHSISSVSAVILHRKVAGKLLIIQKFMESLGGRVDTWAGIKITTLFFVFPVGALEKCIQGKF